MKKKNVTVLWFMLISFLVVSCGDEEDDKPFEQNQTADISNKDDNFVKEIQSPFGVFSFHYDSNAKLTAYRNHSSGKPTIYSIERKNDSIIYKSISSITIGPIQIRLNSWGYCEKDLWGTYAKYDSKGFLLENYQNNGVREITTRNQIVGNDIKISVYNVKEKTGETTGYTDTYEIGNEKNDTNIDLNLFIRPQNHVNPLSALNLFGQKSEHLFSCLYHDAPKSAAFVKGGGIEYTYHWYEVKVTKVFRDSKNRISQINIIYRAQKKDGNITETESVIKVLYEYVKTKGL